MEANGEQRVAIVAALAEEVAGVLERLEGLHEEEGDGAAWHAGILAGRQVLLSVTGDGARNAERGLRRLLAAARPDRLVVIGVAGALSGDLDVGSVLLARRIVSAAGAAPDPDPAWAARLAPRLTAGTVYSAEQIASTPEAKGALQRRIAGGGPAVVDLESATYAAVATAAGVPFQVLRAVSDRADEPLPFDFERFRGADGGVSRSQIVRYAALRPSAMTALLELRRRVELCADRLAYAVEEVLPA